MSLLTSSTARHEALRARSKATWEAGDFGLVAKYNEPIAAQFMSAVAPTAGARVLDLACGTGNLAILAARRGCVTSGLDIASNLIAQAKHRATLEGLQIDFTEGDAEELPYADASFDVVVSMFGMMFAPCPDLAGSELLRVCRPGGTIALANWTPEGFIGENYRVVSRHIPPLPSPISPLLWGDEATLHERIGAHLSEIRMKRCVGRLRYPFPPAQAVDFLRQFYGPTVRAFASLDPCGQSRLQADLEKMFLDHNRSTDGGTEVESEYLQVIATRR